MNEENLFVNEKQISFEITATLDEKQRKQFEELLNLKNLVTITATFNGEKFVYENCSIEYWWNVETYLVKWKQEMEDGSNGEFIINRKKMEKIANEII